MPPPPIPCIFIFLECSSPSAGGHFFRQRSFLLLSGNLTLAWLPREPPKLAASLLLKGVPPP